MNICTVCGSQCPDCEYNSYRAHEDCRVTNTPPTRTFTRGHSGARVVQVSRKPQGISFSPIGGGFQRNNTVYAQTLRDEFEANVLNEHQ